MGKNGLLIVTNIDIVVRYIYNKAYFKVRFVHFHGLHPYEFVGI